MICVTVHYVKFDSTDKQLARRLSGWWVEACRVDDIRELPQAGDADILLSGVPTLEEALEVANQEVIENEKKGITTIVVVESLEGRKPSY